MNKKNQRGAAVIEFALVVPLLLVIVFGIIEFGVLLYDKAMLTNASREGARYGIVFDSGTPGRCDNGNLTSEREAEIVGVVENYCADHLISFGGDPGLTITVEVPNNCASGEPLIVLVDYEFSFLVFSNLIRLVGGGMAEQLDLTAVTVMRLE